MWHAGDEGEEKAAEKFKLDFSGLKRQHMAARSEKDRAALDAEFRREIEARSSALAHVAPNLKALDQFQAVKVHCPIVLFPETAGSLFRSTHSHLELGSDRDI